MPVNISNISITNSWQYLLDRVNEVITVIKTQALTTNTTATGNCAITGTFTANILSGVTIQGTNVNIPGFVSNTSNLNITANSTVGVKITSNTLSSTTLNLNSISFNSAFTANTTGLTNQVVDSFILSSYKSCDYILDVKDNIANNHTHSKLSILNVSGAVFNTEYGMIVSNNSIGQFTVSSNATHALLYFQPASATSTTIKGFKTLLVP